jgi:catechol 2,3-dioxygenase-like lactoylglutathione lyase family enzyme
MTSKASPRLGPAIEAGSPQMVPIQTPFILALTVSDLEASVAYYSDVLGFRAMERRIIDAASVRRLMETEDTPAEDLVLLESPESDAVLKLMHFGGASHLPETRACPWVTTHFAFRTPEIEDVHERLSRSSFPPITRRVERAPSGMKAFFTRDPDGYLIEIYERP